MLDHYRQQRHSATTKAPPPPLYVPVGSILFRLLCHSSRAGGVIGNSGSVIKHLQNQTSAKIRVDDPASHSDECVIFVIASAAVDRTLPFGDDVSAAQEAVVRVFERVVEVAAETEVAEGAEMVVGVVSCRLLVEGFSVGVVMGKGGKMIQNIRRESGCKKIRVLGPDSVPASAWPDDEVVEIEGDILAVKKALIAITRCIQDKTPVDKYRRLGNQPFEAIPNESLIPSFSNYAYKPQRRDVIFRMLCSIDIVGGLIGKGGTIVRALQQESGALVVIGPTIRDCLERSIIISSMEDSDSANSASQNAAVLVYNRLIEAASENGIDSGSSGVSARLLISPNQVGCLMGKGGSIITDMKRATGTYIRIIGDDQAPKCASENDEVVQITGEPINVRHALYVVTGKLRDHLFSSKMSNSIGASYNASTANRNINREKSRGPPSKNLRHTNLTESMDHLSLNDYNDRAPSASSYASQHAAACVNSGSNGDDRQLASVEGGIEFGSGSRTAIVMNTTVEIRVPDNIIGSVYGENGSNLARLREISGAKVVVHEPRPGTTDRIVVISGTPDETHAAQSLLQAFILTGRS